MDPFHFLGIQTEQLSQIIPVFFHSPVRIHDPINDHTSCSDTRRGNILSFGETANPFLLFLNIASPDFVAREKVSLVSSTEEMQFFSDQRAFVIRSTIRYR